MAAKMPLPVPDGVGMDVAVCCPVQGLTAHYLTTDAHAGLVRPGEWMLIHGVGGGTCQWAAQMAKIRGYKVIGTCAKGKGDVGKATGDVTRRARRSALYGWCALCGTVPHRAAPKP